MSKYISELMSPQLMGVIYAFVGFIIALYVLSVVYVFIDARRRGASLPSTAPARSAVPPSRRTLSCARFATPRFATCAPAAIVRSTRTGRSAPTAELASSNASIAGPAASRGRTTGTARHT